MIPFNKARRHGILMLFLSFGANAEVLKDPRLRDEDISRSAISATYSILPDGMYEYLYTIESNKDNKGEIDTFKLDISCQDKFSPVSFSEPPTKMFENNSIDGMHIPVQHYGVMYATYWLSITGDNQLVWGVGIKPGETARGYRVISPASPGKLKYTLEPLMDADGWDYISYEENDPSVPWIEDFTVTGMITGPACPSKAEIFPGADRQRRESAETNSLLTYSAPLRDRFHVEKGIKEIELMIHYSDKIDPKSFKAVPGYIKHLFDPKPGTTQTVKLPLKKNGKDTKKAKFKLEVHAVDAARGKDKTSFDRMKDKDEFEIRIDD